MKLAILFTGGKDSCYAMYKVMKEHDISCLISIFSENKESYMFHTPNIELTSLQAEAIGLPLIIKKTPGIKEKELEELEEAIREAKKTYKIRGIATGALESVYQASRIQKICRKLNLQCVNPLWKINQVQLLQEILNNKFEVIISGIFAYPLTEEWLGRKIDSKTIKELKELQKQFKINPAGEGGELETTVLNAPFFTKRIRITKSSKTFKNHAGVLKIDNAVLE